MLIYGTKIGFLYGSEQEKIKNPKKKLDIELFQYGKKSFSILYNSLKMMILLITLNPPVFYLATKNRWV